MLLIFFFYFLSASVNFLSVFSFSEIILIKAGAFESLVKFVSWSAAKVTQLIHLLRALIASSTFSSFFFTICISSCSNFLSRLTLFPFFYHPRISYLSFKINIIFFFLPPSYFIILTCTFDVPVCKLSAILV